MAICTFYVELEHFITCIDFCTHHGNEDSGVVSPQQIPYNHNRHPFLILGISSFVNCLKIQQTEKKISLIKSETKANFLNIQKAP